MINTHELRLGNLVDIYKGNKQGTVRFCEVESIDSGVNGFDCDDIHPIQLTSKVLLKCGFIEASISDLYGGYLSPLDKAGKRHRIRTYSEGKAYYTPSELSAPLYITSLHQLQNLHFALTGEELVYTL